jgi:hypothetical protein
VWTRYVYALRTRTEREREREREETRRDEMAELRWPLCRRRRRRRRRRRSHSRRRRLHHCHRHRHHRLHRLHRHSRCCVVVLVSAKHECQVADDSLGNIHVSLAIVRMATTTTAATTAATTTTTTTTATISLYALVSIPWHRLVCQALIYLRRMQRHLKLRAALPPYLVSPPPLTPTHRRARAIVGNSSLMDSLDIPASVFERSTG